MKVDRNIKQISLKINTPLYKRNKVELKAFLKAYIESFEIYHKESEERELLGRGLRDIFHT